MRRRHAGVHRGSGPDGAREQPRDSDREAEPRKSRSSACRAARAVYAPSFLTGLSRRSATSPPTDFNTSGGRPAGLHQCQPLQATAAFSSRCGGAAPTRSCSTGRAARRRTTSTRRSIPQLGSGLNAIVNQPLLRNFKIDANRQRLSAGQEPAAGGGPPAAAAPDADGAERAGRVLQPGRRDRRARRRAGVARSVARRRSKNNQTRVEVGTMAPIDIVVGRGGSREQRGERDHPAGGRSRAPQDQLRTLIMNPSQPDFWTARFAPSEQPVLAARAINVDAAIKNALANRTDILAASRSRWRPRTST